MTWTIPLGDPRWTPTVLRGLMADRPAAGQPFLFYWARDVNQLSFWDPEDGWVVLSGEGGVVDAGSFGVRGDGTDETEKLAEAVANTPEGFTLFIPVQSVLRTSAPVDLLEHRNYVTSWSGSWLYRYTSPAVGALKPLSSFVGDAVLRIRGNEISGRTADNDGIFVRNLVVDASAISGGNVDCLRVEGLCRDLTFERVSVRSSRGTGAGLHFLTGAGDAPPRGIRVHGAAAYACANHGIRLNGVTDSFLEDMLAVGNTGRGIYVSNSGENTFDSCRAVFNGSDGWAFDGTTPMGMTTLLAPATDRNSSSGILISQSGAHPIQIVGPRLRRDGRGAADQNHAALKLSGTSGAPVCPVEVVIGQSVVGVNDPDDAQGTGIESPQWGVRATWASRLNLVGGEWWGVDGGLSDNGNNELRFQRNARFFSGVRAAQVRHYPDVIQGEGETITLRAASETWASMPSGETEFIGGSSRRTVVDLTDRNRILWWVGVSTQGAAGSTLKLQYTTDLTGAAGWADLSPTVALDAGTGHRMGTWAAVPQGAKTLVMVRPVGAGGNGATSPVFTGIGFAVRA